MKIEVVPATKDDMRAGAIILNDWIDKTEWMPRVHSHDDVIRHFTTTVFVERQCYVAKSANEVCGMMAMAPEEHFISALYVGEKSRGGGVGSALVEKARSDLKAKIELWTFQANEPAQKFYAKHGFSEVRRTDGDNEEKLPDILLRWSARQ